MLGYSTYATTIVEQDTGPVWDEGLDALGIQLPNRIEAAFVRVASKYYLPRYFTTSSPGTSRRNSFALYPW